jgi:acylphosphatase
MRVHMIVRGEVQGVSFRMSTLREAQRLGVVGWVRNLPDGSVELEAEGPNDQVRQLVEYARTGPPSAIVRHVQLDELDDTGPDVKDKGFTIRR